MPPAILAPVGTSGEPSSADRGLIPDDGAPGEQDSQNKLGAGKTVKGTSNLQASAMPSHSHASAYTE